MTGINIIILEVWHNWDITLIVNKGRQIEVCHIVFIKCYICEIVSVLCLNRPVWNYYGALWNRVTSLVHTVCKVSVSNLTRKEYRIVVKLLDCYILSVNRLCQALIMAEYIQIKCNLTLLKLIFSSTCYTSSTFIKGITSCECSNPCCHFCIRDIVTSIYSISTTLGNNSSSCSCRWVSMIIRILNRCVISSSNQTTSNSLTIYFYI